MNRDIPILGAVLTALAVGGAVTWSQSPTNAPAMAVIQTNWDGTISWVVRTNVVMRTNTEFLSPSETARVYVSLLDAHMAAVQYQWVVKPESQRRYEEYVDRLVQATAVAPMSDAERHAAELRERELREAIRVRDVEIAGLKAYRVRLTNEIARLKREIERREK